MKKIIDAIKKALGMDKKSPDSPSQGFTLIELLVVIAVIGVLAAGILLAINPLEQIRRAQDSSIKQQTASIGRAVESYYISSVSGTADYPDGSDWLSTDLDGEFKTTPVGNAVVTTNCTAVQLDSGFCLRTTAASATTPSFVVFTTIKNQSDRERALSAGATGGCTGQTNTYYVYSSLLGKAGIRCTAPAATFGTTPASDILY